MFCCWLVSFGEFLDIFVYIGAYLVLWLEANCICDIFCLCFLCILYVIFLSVYLCAPVAIARLDIDKYAGKKLFQHLEKKYKTKVYLLFRNLKNFQILGNEKFCKKNLTVTKALLFFTDVIMC